MKKSKINLICSLIILSVLASTPILIDNYKISVRTSTTLSSQVVSNNHASLNSNIPKSKIYKISLTNHGPIQINGNSDFSTQATNEGWSGLGSSKNPYIIENYLINGNGLSGITIQNTNVYFIIRNIEIYNAVGTDLAGIFLNNVQNGLINNNSIHDCSNGMYLEKSGFINLTANYIMNIDVYGFFFHYAFFNHFIRMENNQVENVAYGYYLCGSNFVLTNNSAIHDSFGFSLLFLSNATFTDNIALYNDNYGFDMSTVNITTFENNTANFNNNAFNIDESSGLNFTNNTVLYNKIGIEILDSQNLEFYNNTVSNNNQGFQIIGELWFPTQNNIFHGNILLNNSDFGFSLIDSVNYNIFSFNQIQFSDRGYFLGREDQFIKQIPSNNIFSSEILTNNNYGFYLEDSVKNTFQNCTISQNTYGLFLSKSNNHNHIIQNKIQTSYYGIYLSNTGSISNVFSLNEIQENEYGFYQLNGLENFYGNNSIIDNFMGLSFVNVNNSRISNNNFTQNSVGILLKSSNNASIDNNFIANNPGIGTLVNGSSSLNKITFNYYKNNSIHAKDDSTGFNTWDKNLYFENQGQLAFQPIEGTSKVYDYHPQWNDTDKDGMSNYYEIINGLDPNVNDSYLDHDNDGMPNLWEFQMGLNSSLNDSMLDKDGDGFPNLWEYQHGFNSLLNETYLDFDNDGMPNFWEYSHGLDPTKADANGDLDGDGLKNIQEYNLGTNPQSNDTDGDQIPDNAEVKLGLNPLVNDALNDPDKDGLSNIEEFKLGTDPFNPDTDGDGVPDGVEVSLGLNPLNGNYLDNLIYNKDILVTITAVAFVLMSISLPVYKYFIKRKLRSKI